MGSFNSTARSHGHDARHTAEALTHDNQSRMLESDVAINVWNVWIGRDPDLMYCSDSAS